MKLYYFIIDLIFDNKMELLNEQKEQKHCNCHCHTHGNNNNHHHHHHHHSMKHFHLRKTLLSKTYLFLFVMSIVLLITILIVHVITKICHISFPSIFFPGILIYITTFIVAGGILGSYGPINKSEPELMYMRKCTSSVMFIICIIIFPIFLYQNYNFYSSVKESKIFCLDNDNKSKFQIYSELIDDKEKSYSLRNNFEHKYKNGLTCMESRKCIKSIGDSKLFVCNYNYQEIINNNIKCNKVFETEHLINMFDNPNTANFASSCVELKKDKIRPDVELYKCIGDKNLCEDDSNTEQDKIELKKYYEKNINYYNNHIANLTQKIEYYGDDYYSYETKCLGNTGYYFYVFLIFTNILIMLSTSVTWAYLGISNILKMFGYIEDNELIYFREKMKEMNNIYQNVHLSQENQNQIDENTPINVK